MRHLKAAPFYAAGCIALVVVVVAYVIVGVVANTLPDWQ